MKITRCARFKNPTNDYVLECSWPCLFGLFLGPFSLGVRGAWMTALGWLLITAGSVGWLWLLFPFISTRLLRQHFLIAGWHELPAELMRLIIDSSELKKPARTLRAGQANQLSSR